MIYYFVRMIKTNSPKALTDSPGRIRPFECTLNQRAEKPSSRAWVNSIWKSTLRSAAFTPQLLTSCCLNQSLFSQRQTLAFCPYACVLCVDSEDGERIQLPLRDGEAQSSVQRDDHQSCTVSADVHTLYLKHASHQSHEIIYRLECIYNHISMIRVWFLVNNSQQDRCCEDILALLQLNIGCERHCCFVIGHQRVLVCVQRFFTLVTVWQLLHLQHFNSLRRTPGEEQLPARDLL